MVPSSDSAASLHPVMVSSAISLPPLENRLLYSMRFCRWKISVTPILASSQTPANASSRIRGSTVIFCVVLTSLAIT